jgi:energy-coupling factor transport system ATP-binding protein
MIQINDLSFRYANSNVQALKEINLNIRRGECICLTGASGSGKSSLLLAIKGLIPHFIKGRFDGSVSINGIDTREADITTLSENIGLVFQNPETQIFNLTVKEEVAFGLENLLVPRDEIVKRVKEALKLAGLTGFENRNPADLSGGEKQKVCIASILAMKPDILLFDEPLSQLDEKGKSDLLVILKGLKGKVTMIIGEHNVSAASKVSDRIVLMNGGEIIAEGEEVDAEMEAFFKRFGVRWKVGIRRYESKRNCEEVAKLKDVSFLYRDKEVLSNFSLSIGRREFIGITGENGAGKTTVLKIMAGLLKAKKGTVQVLGMNPSPKKVFSKVGFLFQNPEYQIFERTVRDEVAFALRKKGLQEAEIEERVFDALESVGIGDLGERNPLTLSMGEKHRVALAAIIALDPEIIILDEPTSGLDYGNATRMLEKIKSLGKTVVIASHDRELLEMCCDAIYQI